MVISLNLKVVAKVTFDKKGIYNGKKNGGV